MAIGLAEARVRLVTAQREFDNIVEMRDDGAGSRKRAGVELVKWLDRLIHDCRDKKDVPESLRDIVKAADDIKVKIGTEVFGITPRDLVAVAARVEDKRPETAADCLEKAVEFLDLGDRLVEIVSRQHNLRNPSPGDNVQKDLRRFAEFLRKNPEVDAALMAALEESA